MAIDVNTDALPPGSTVRLEFRIIGTDAATNAAAISDLKRAVATDQRFDYQGSRVYTVGDQTLRRDIQMLLIYATVRKTRRADRALIRYASLSEFDAYVRAASIVWWETAEYMQAAIADAAEAAAATAKDVEDMLPWLAVLVLAIVAYKFFA